MKLKPFLDIGKYYPKLDDFKRLKPKEKQEEKRLKPKPEVKQTPCKSTTLLLSTLSILSILLLSTTILYLSSINILCKS